MNIVDKTLTRIRLMFIDSQPTQMMLPLFLAIAVMGSSLYVVRIKHNSRSLTTEIEQARVERERLQMEWSQLQLEEAALAHNGRVENAAREELGMAEPRKYVILQMSSMERVP